MIDDYCKRRELVPQCPQPSDREYSWPLVVWNNINHTDRKIYNFIRFHSDNVIHVFSVLKHD